MLVLSHPFHEDRGKDGARGSPGRSGAEAAFLRCPVRQKRCIFASGTNSLRPGRRVYRLIGVMTFASAKTMFAPAVATTEEELARQESLAVANGLKRQDAGLLDQLIVRYQHRLMRYLLYLTGNREMAEDLFQEVWMRVLVRGAQFNGQARFDTWLFTIARNLVIDHRRKRTMSSLDELFETGSDDDRPMSVEVADSQPTPFDSFSSIEDREHISTALLQLDTLYREVLVLRFHEELTLEEIAKVTRAPLSTVKSRLYRGLAAIKPKLERAQMRRLEMAE